MTYKGFVEMATEALRELYPVDEAKAIAVRVLSTYLQIPDYKYISEPERGIAANKLTLLQEAVSQLSGGRPLQYVLGYTEFAGLKFKVGEGVLIPRPETEELFNIVADDCDLLLAKWDEEENGVVSVADANGAVTGAEDDSAVSVADANGAVSGAEDDGALSVSDANGAMSGEDADGEVAQGDAPDYETIEVGDKELNILDICTGSGCLAYTLAAEFPVAQLYGCDISNEALRYACKQKIKLSGARPVFFWADVLSNPPAGLPKFDVIVSNPPYVLEGEKTMMRPNVLDYEPPIALFVPDDDPLKFYKAIKKWAEVLLREGGKCYLEINERFGPQVVELFAGGSIIKDINDKDRFVVWQKR